MVKNNATNIHCLWFLGLVFLALGGHESIGTIALSSERSHQSDHGVEPSDARGRHGDGLRYLRWKPKPTPYPPAFRIDFSTNITRGASAASSVPLVSSLYYDWTKRAQRVDHPAGAYECVHFYDVTDVGCTLYFLEDGMYRVLPTTSTATTTPKSAKPSCCLDLDGVGPPPPDWATQANGTFTKMMIDEYSEFTAYEWIFDHVVRPPGVPPMIRMSDSNNKGSRESSSKPPVETCHTYRELALVGEPLLFTFPDEAGDGRQDFHFDAISMVVGPQDASLFELPGGCEGVRCDARGDEEDTPVGFALNHRS